MSALARLVEVYESIRSFAIPALSPPVIDGVRPDGEETLPGLRLLRDELKRDCDLLGQHGNSPAPSTNAPYLVAVWDELVHARQPVAVYRTFSPVDKARGEKPRAVKVDVVAENGARWVRVNTIKNARLMMEFREIDSYLTSDEEDETGPRLAQPEFDNSVLRMGRELLAAAKANPVSLPIPLSSSTATVAPQVTIRLTRLDPSEDDTTDHRIGRTIQCLRDMGIDVQLGERPYPHPNPIPQTPATPRQIEPTANINLDLSALIALISDISHSPLPRTQKEAHARFQPPQNYLDWKRDRVKSLARQNRCTHHSFDNTEDIDVTWDNSGQHSRALAAQAIQEMGNDILQEMRERMSVHPLTSITFWTTSEARQRCLQIVSKIGGEKERQRADALLGATFCTQTLPVPAPAVASMDGPENAERGASTDAYWKHSRYPTGFLPLVPVRFYPSILPVVADEDRQSTTTFFDALAQMCTGILSYEAVSVSQLSEPLPTPTTVQVLEEISPAAQTSLPKLTVHTVRSILAGASRGHTTLTTNKSSVKAVLKEMRRVCGRAAYDPEPMGQVSEKAALWILDPRSLSEGMRSE